MMRRRFIPYRWSVLMMKYEVTNAESLQPCYATGYVTVAEQSSFARWISWCWSRQAAGGGSGSPGLPRPAQWHLILCPRWLLVPEMIMPSRRPVWVRKRYGALQYECVRWRPGACQVAASVSNTAGVACCTRRVIWWPYPWGNEFKPARGHMATDCSWRILVSRHRRDGCRIGAGETIESGAWIEATRPGKRGSGACWLLPDSYNAGEIAYQPLWGHQKIWSGWSPVCEEEGSTGRIVFVYTERCCSLGTPRCISGGKGEWSDRKQLVWVPLRPEEMLIGPAAPQRHHRSCLVCGVFNLPQTEWFACIAHEQASSAMVRSWKLRHPRGLNGLIKGKVSVARAWQDAFVDRLGPSTGISELFPSRANVTNGHSRIQYLSRRRADLRVVWYPEISISVISRRAFIADKTQ